MGTSMCALGVTRALNYLHCRQPHCHIQGVLTVHLFETHVEGYYSGDLVSSVAI
jgi:hypothetical protein